MRLIGGLVFPQEVLVSPWFLLLATVVAFNTIIYLGLTLSKFVPWPQQFSPSQVRRAIPFLDRDTSQEGPPVAKEHLHDNAYDSIRADIVARDVPWSLALVGLAMMGVSVVNFAISPANADGSHTAQLLAGLLFVVLALIIGRRRFRSRVTMWMWASTSMLAVGLTAEEAIRDGDQTPLGFALIFLVASAPIAMAWTPALVSSLVQLGLFTYATFEVGGAQDRQFALVGLVAAVTGWVLLRLRLDSVAAIADQWQAAHRLASTDVLTGMLSRPGLLGVLPTFQAAASRQHQQMSVTLVDITNLAELNKAYGNAYGDEVVEAVARAISGATSQGALRARWAGARFIIVGFGMVPNDVVLAHRLDDDISADAATLGKASAEISVASAAGEAGPGSLDALYSAAAFKLDSSELTAATLPGA